MARKTITQLSASFADGQTVSGSNFGDIFDSNFNLQETGTQVASGSLKLFGNLTANEYILSSSVINRQVIDVSGSTHFGDSSDDTHVRTGSMDIKGPMNISGSITPDGSGSYDLGSEANPWREIYVMSSSINFMNDAGVKLATISVDADGKLETLPSGSSTVEPIASFPYTGSAEISGSLITNDSNVEFLGENGFSTRIGYQTSTEGIYGVAIGTQASASHTSDIALGYRAGFGVGSLASNYNIYAGYRTGESSDNNADSILIGRRAGFDNKNINATVAIGFSALRQATTDAGWSGSNSTAVGYAAGYDSHGDYLSVYGTYAGSYIGYGESLADKKSLEITAIGDYSLYLIGKGVKGVVAVGTAAGQGVWGSRRPSGSFATNVGYYSGLGAQNASGVAIGEKAGYFSDSSGSVLVGAYAGSGSLGDHNIMLGYGAGAVVTGDNNIFIGEDVAKNGGTLNKHLKIGSGSLVTISGSLDTGDVIFANTASAGYFSGDGGGLTNVPSSVSSLNDLSDAQSTAQDLTLGQGAGNDMSLGTPTYNTYVGVNAGYDSDTDTQFNVAVGHSAMENNEAGSYQVAIGYQALHAGTTGTISNTAIGWRALKGTIGGAGNVAVGYNAMVTNNATGDYNIAIGYEALNAYYNNQYTIGIGYNAGRQNRDDYSICIGKEAGRGQYGSAGYNVYIGNEAAYKTDNATGSIAIGHKAAYDITDGNYDIVIGYLAGENLTTGCDNIILGQSTGDTLTTGHGNILIGPNIDVATNSDSGQLRIGSGSINTISGSLVTGDVTIYATASAAYFKGDGSQLTNLPESGGGVSETLVQSLAWFM